MSDAFTRSSAKKPKPTASNTFDICIQSASAAAALCIVILLLLLLLFFIVRLPPEIVLNTGREVNEARWPHTCSRTCAFEEKKKQQKKHGKKLRPTVGEIVDWTGRDHRSILTTVLPSRPVPSRPVPSLPSIPSRQQTMKSLEIILPLRPEQDLGIRVPLSSISRR